jgi:uracil-DNA glycosylase
MKTWQEFIDVEKQKPYMVALQTLLLEDRKNFEIFPPAPLTFNAFKQTPFEKVKVVLLGQDPYIHKGQAHGMAFSVQKGIKVPPSLVNIYKELKEDIKFEIPDHGDLTEWANQGVFLLNSILTVRSGTSSSHSELGWTTFTDAAIKALSDHREGVIFVLWGAYAKAKRHLIDDSKHYILEAAHPSPRSADRGFFGCKHFSQINKILEEEGNGFIDWNITKIKNEQSESTEDTGSVDPSGQQHPSKDESCTKDDKA